MSFWTEASFLLENSVKKKYAKYQNSANIDSNEPNFWRKVGYFQRVIEKSQLSRRGKIVFSLLFSLLCIVIDDSRGKRERERERRRKKEGKSNERPSRLDNIT